MSSYDDLQGSYMKSNFEVKKGQIEVNQLIIGTNRSSDAIFGIHTQMIVQSVKAYVILTSEIIRGHQNSIWYAIRLFMVSSSNNNVYDK